MREIEWNIFKRDCHKLVKFRQKKQNNRIETINTRCTIQWTSPKPISHPLTHHFSRTIHLERTSTSPLSTCWNTRSHDRISVLEHPSIIEFPDLYLNWSSKNKGRQRGWWWHVPSSRGGQKKNRRPEDWIRNRYGGKMVQLDVHPPSLASPPLNGKFLD